VVAPPTPYLWPVPEPLSDGALRQPAAALRPFVEGYRGYRLEGFPAGIHKGLPSRHLTFIISFDRPVELAAGPDGTEGGAYWAFVGGMHSQAAEIVHDGNQHGVSINVTPLGARALLGMPAGPLASNVVHLDDLLGSAAVELSDRLAAAPGWDERFDILDEVLLRATDLDSPDPPPEVVRAWRRLVATGGGVEIGELAADVGWSRRHLSERFRAEVGLPPKVAARVLRFERARNLLSLPTRPSLAAVAVACGYYDQAHFNREFAQMTGWTPTRWMAEDLPSVQDGKPEVDGG
jgi:AraC-like DNA-binding protein